MLLSNDGLVAFHYRLYGTFFYNKIGSIISIGDLPTTNIIEPILKKKCKRLIDLQKDCIIGIGIEKEKSHGS